MQDIIRISLKMECTVQGVIKIYTVCACRWVAKSLISVTSRDYQGRFLLGGTSTRAPRNKMNQIVFNIY